MPPEPILVTTSVTSASMVVKPRAKAIDTR